MTATNHGLFGAVIAITLQSHPVAAIMVAPLSHFVLDAIPHFGTNGDVLSKKFFRILFIDATLAVACTLYIAWLWPHIALLLVACAFLAASPDLMWAYYQYAGIRLKNRHLVPKFHAWIQWSQTTQGIAVEAVWFIVFFSGLVFAGVQ